jgi:hypothetical protein
VIDTYSSLSCCLLNERIIPCANVKNVGKKLNGISSVITVVIRKIVKQDARSAANLLENFIRLFAMLVLKNIKD